MNIKISNGMQLIKKNFTKCSLLLFTFVFPIISLAQEGEVPPPCDISGKICNPLAEKGIETIDGLIKVLLEGIIKIGMPIVALAIIYSGFLFVFARGNSEKLSKAKSTLLYTLIGAAVLLGSWAIAQVISETVLSL